MDEPIKQVTVSVLPDGRLSRQSSAAYLGVSAATLASWASRKIGPEPIRVGGRIFYRKTDLDAFVSAGAKAA